MKRSEILNILFWIFLIIGIILLIWYIFGNSPTELAITLTFILTLMFKMWTVSDEIKDLKHEVRMSFVKVKTDFDELKTKLKVKKK